MYEFTINRKLGDYVKGSEGSIYEVMSISVSITINEMTGKEEVRTFYEVIDLQDPLGQYYIVSESMVSDVTDEEVELYIKNVVSPFEDIIAEDPFKGVIEAINSQISQSGFYIEPGGLEVEIESFNEKEMSDMKEEKRTLNHVLDDYLKYKDLTLIFRDDTYEKEMNVLIKEFEEFPVGNKEGRTADDILDDYLTYKKFTKALECDEDEYKDKMNELMSEFNEISNVVYE